MSANAIAVGAPKTPYSDSTGYFYILPITATPPADALAPIAGGINVGYVGEEGVTLSATLDTEMIKDWNLDDVLQLKNGASASVEAPIFGFDEGQARAVYGDDSVIKTTGGFKVNWAGEIPPMVWLVFELRGTHGDARLVCKGQVASPGDVQFVTNRPITHTITAALFRDDAFKDAKGRPGYFSLIDEGGNQLDG